MAFADTLLPASFRGVPFGVWDNTGMFGRRGQLHEYPARDIPYAEDLGRRARKLAFRAFVIGDDCAARRDALIAALEQKGPGLLVHPSAGAVLMQPDPMWPCRYTERWDHGRVVEFELRFVEPGRMLYPQAAPQTQAASQGAAGNVNLVAGGALQSAATPNGTVTVGNIDITNIDITNANSSLAAGSQSGLQPPVTSDATSPHVFDAI